VALLTAVAVAGGEIAKYLNMKQLKVLIDEWVAVEKAIALTNDAWPNIDDSKLESLYLERKQLDDAMLKQAALVPGSV